jgi:hypothetical protein
MVGIAAAMHSLKSNATGLHYLPQASHWGKEGQKPGGALKSQPMGLMTAR